MNGLLFRRGSRTPLTTLMLKEGVAAFLLIVGAWSWSMYVYSVEFTHLSALLVVMMVHYELFRTFDRGIGQAAFACVLRFYSKPRYLPLIFVISVGISHWFPQEWAFHFFLFVVFILIFVLRKSGVEAHLEHAKADSQRYSPTSNATTIPLSNNRQRGSGSHALWLWRWGIPDVVLRIKWRVVLFYQRLAMPPWSWGIVIRGSTCIFKFITPKSVDSPKIAHFSQI